MAAPDFNKLLQQAQKMQQQMQQAQEQLKSKEIVSTAGAGLVEIVRNGHGDALSTKLNPEATPGMSTDDREILEALITAAINDGQQKIQAESQATMSDGMGGFDLSGGLGNLFK